MYYRVFRYYIVCSMGARKKNENCFVVKRVLKLGFGKIQNV